MVVHFSNGWRNKQFNMYSTNYCSIHTICATKGVHKFMDIEKSDFKEIITNENLINSFQNLRNPLQKNLADMYMNRQDRNMATDSNFECKNSYDINKFNEPQTGSRPQNVPALSSLTNFVTRMFNSITNVVTFVSQRGGAPPTTPPFHDCVQCSDMEQKDSGFDESDMDGSPPLFTFNYINNNGTINKHQLNCNSPSPLGFINIKSNGFQPSDSYEDVFEDAHSNNDFEQLKIGFIELPPDHLEKNMIVQEKTDDNSITQNLPYTRTKPLAAKTENIDNISKNMEKSQLVLADTGQINEATNEINMQHNLHDSTSKKDYCDLIHKVGHDELKIFDEESPIKYQNGENNHYFDEVRGKFTNNSYTDSEDSFQIVFSDSPQQDVRTRKVSDCDSEDSFIIFDDDAQDNCYMSHDVFGSDYDSSDDDSDNMIRCSAGNLSRTISDLTDERLYEEGATVGYNCGLDCEDEIDSAAPLEVKCIEETYGSPSASGILVGTTKRNIKKQKPPKKVTFSDAPPKVHLMCVWAFAAKQARIGDWAKVLLDRSRFKQRIVNVEMAISWVLKPNHRSRVMFHRFMPWWNAQKRQEKAEKLAKEKERILALEYKEQEIINVDIDTENIEMQENKPEITPGVDNNSLIIAKNDCVRDLRTNGNDTEVQDNNSITNHESNNADLIKANNKCVHELNKNDIKTLVGNAKITAVSENTNEVTADNGCVQEFNSHTPKINNKSALYNSADTLLCNF